MKPYQLDFHVFVCLNERPEGHPRGCCKAKGAEEILVKFKQEIKKKGLNIKIRAQKAGCLDTCEKGPTVVIYPEGVWYGGVTVADVNEIVDSHLVAGKHVERLKF